MTRLETLENRLSNLREVRDFYVKGEKIGGKIYTNRKSGKYMRIVTMISKEVRLLKQ